MNRRNHAFAPIVTLMALFAWLPACSSATPSEADVEPNAKEMSEALQPQQKDPTNPTSCSSDLDCKSGTYCCVPCSSTVGTCAAGCPQVICP